MQLTAIKHKGIERALYMPTPLTEKAKKLLEYLEIKQLKNIEHEDSLKMRLLY